MPTRCAGYGSTDQQQITFFVYLGHFQILGRGSLITHLTSHLLTLENSAWRLALTDGAGSPVRDRIAMGGVLHTEVMSLHAALKTFAF